jgi:hypothetical protein
LAVNPPRRPGRSLTGPTGSAGSGGIQPVGFTLKPVGATPIARVERGKAPERVERASLPKRVLERLKTAVTDADIDAQIDRMLRFITMGLIDRGAPRGSYLNLIA